MPSGDGPQSPRRLNAAIRHRQALDLRKSGATYDQIAEALGYSCAGSAYRAIQNAIRKMLREPAEEVRDLELARLDRMLMGLWPKIQTGDVPAVNAGLRVMERRARLLGLDQPTVVDITGLTREWAQQAGLDPATVLSAAEEIVRTNQV